MLPNRYYISAYTDQLEGKNRKGNECSYLNGCKTVTRVRVIRNCVTVEGCGFRSVEVKSMYENYAKIQSVL